MTSPGRPVEIEVVPEKIEIPNTPAPKPEPVKEPVKEPVPA